MRRRAVLFGLAFSAATPAFALYDPKPDDWLSAVQGAWRGSLTYRDYSEPKRMVTLPTRAFVALAAPASLVLHYVFDDGPSKTVFSYEKMRFDFPGHQVTWVTGQDARSSVCIITSDSISDSARSLLFERNEGGVTKRFTMVLSDRAWTLSEDEVTPAGLVSFRNRYEFARSAPIREPKEAP
jgi:hypothetical protein